MRTSNPVVSWAVNHPRQVNLLLVLLVAVHAVVAARFGWGDVYGGLVHRQQGMTLLPLHLAVGGLAALVGSFSGVVVTFALNPDASSFRGLRLKSGPQIRGNWVAVVATSFLAAFLGLADAVLNLAGVEWGAAVGTMTAVLLCGHGALRLVWLLGELAHVVFENDRKEAAKASRGQLGDWEWGQDEPTVAADRGR